MSPIVLRIIRTVSITAPSRRRRRPRRDRCDRRHIWSGCRRRYRRHGRAAWPKAVQGTCCRWRSAELRPDRRTIASTCCVHRLDVDQRVGRIGRAFQIDQRDVAHRLGPAHHRIEFRARRAGRKVDYLTPNCARMRVDERLGRRVERARMDDRRRPAEPAQAAESAIAVMPLEKVSASSASSQICKPILENLLVRPVEARIDEALGSPPPGRLPVTPSKRRFPAAALSKTKVDVRKIGGFQRAFREAGSKP